MKTIQNTNWAGEREREGEILTWPARVWLGVFEGLRWGREGDPFEDIHVIAKEAELFVLPLHEASFCVHNAQLDAHGETKGEVLLYTETALYGHSSLSNQLLRNTPRPARKNVHTKTTRKGPTTAGREAGLAGVRVKPSLASSLCSVPSPAAQSPLEIPAGQNLRDSAGQPGAAEPSQAPSKPTTTSPPPCLLHACPVGPSPVELLATGCSDNPPMP